MTDGRCEDFVLYQCVLREPLFTIVEVVEGGRELIVSQTIRR